MIRPGVLGLSLVTLLLLPSAAAGQGELRFAELGECRLQGGEVIRDCRVGYRTFGRLDAERANVVLVPTPFMGTSEDLVGMVEPLGLTRDSSVFVVLVDALGNGVSSSPSNGGGQAGAAFPRITIRDMVRSQYRLLTEELGVRSVRAILGISMGGMQGYEWLFAYPEFVDGFVSVVSSPRLDSYDIVLWSSLESALALYQECECEEAARVVGGIGFLVGNSPDFHARVTPRDSIGVTLERVADQGLSVGRAQDITSQLQAMIAHDVTARFGGSLEAAAAAIQARVLTLVSPVDHVVTPGPAREFARLLGGEVVELASDCGHNGFGCDALQAGAAILRFLGSAR